MKRKLLDARDVRAAVFRFTIRADEVMEEIERQRAIRLLEENTAETRRLLDEDKAIGPSKSAADLLAWRKRHDAIDRLFKETRQVARGRLPEGQAMKRSPMPRPSKPIARRTPMKRANPERRARLHQRNFDGSTDVLDHDGWIRSHPCCICKAPRTDAAHAIARGFGGAKSGWWLLVPMCREHHDEHHRIGNSGMLDRYHMDLPGLARTLTRKHLTEIGAI